jgi:hypothetical protein
MADEPMLWGDADMYTTDENCLADEPECRVELLIGDRSPPQWGVDATTLVLSFTAFDGSEFVYRRIE